VGSRQLPGGAAHARGAAGGYHITRKVDAHMSQSIHTEIYDHDGDAGPPDPGEDEPYPRRRSPVRPATLMAGLAGVLAVAFAVGALSALLPSGKAARVAEPVPRTITVTARHRTHAQPRRHAHPAPKHSPSPSPKPKPKPKPLVRHPRQRNQQARQAAPPSIIVQVEPAQPAPPAPATVPQPAPATVPHPAPATVPQRRRAPALHLVMTYPARGLANRRKSVTRNKPVVHRVAGYVQCSTTSVEGVWVVANNGGSGWAKWRGVDSNVAYYWYRLPHGGQYSVHVGCGGSTSQWSTASQSHAVSGRFNDFFCYDVAGERWFGFCKHD
jgi:hypothetical protein